MTQPRRRQCPSPTYLLLLVLASLAAHHCKASVETVMPPVKVFAAERGDIERCIAPRSARPARIRGIPVSGSAGPRQRRGTHLSRTKHNKHEGKTSAKQARGQPGRGQTVFHRVASPQAPTGHHLCQRPANSSQASPNIRPVVNNGMSEHAKRNGHGSILQCPDVALLDAVELSVE